jgi:hypothetical protein
VKDDTNLLLRCSQRELTNRLRDRAPGPVQDPNTVAKDDGLALDRDIARATLVKASDRRAERNGGNRRRG